MAAVDGPQSSPAVGLTPSAASFARPAQAVDELQSSPAVGLAPSVASFAPPAPAVDELQSSPAVGLAPSVASFAPPAAPAAVDELQSSGLASFVPPAPAVDEQSSSHPVGLTLSGASLSAAASLGRSAHAVDEQSSSYQVGLTPSAASLGRSIGHSDFSEHLLPQRGDASENVYLATNSLSTSKHPDAAVPTVSSKFTSPSALADKTDAEARPETAAIAAAGDSEARPLLSSIKRVNEDLSATVDHTPELPERTPKISSIPLAAEKLDSNSNAVFDPIPRICSMETLAEKHFIRGDDKQAEVRQKSGPLSTQMTKSKQSTCRNFKKGSAITTAVMEEFEPIIQITDDDNGIYSSSEGDEMMATAMSNSQFEARPMHSEVPDDLPLHFRLDVACVWLGAKEGKYANAEHGLCTMKGILQKEWLEARCMQEQAWREYGQLPTEVGNRLRKSKDESMHIDGNDLFSGKITLDSRLQDWIDDESTLWRRHERWKKRDDIVSVLRIGCPTPNGGFTDLTARHLEQAMETIYAQMIVEVENDPILDELGYCGPTTFMVPIYLYSHCIMQASLSEDPFAATREIRASRIPTFEFAMTMRYLPYPSCKLPAPGFENALRSGFPDDRIDTLETCLKQTLLSARGTLTYIFWQCFNEIFPEEGEQPMPKAVGKMGAFEMLYVKSKSLYRKWRLCNCRTRKEALRVLYTIITPTAFQVPFCRRVSKNDMPESTGVSGLRDAITHALRAAARDVRDANMVPGLWKKRTDHETWPLTAREPSDEQTYLNALGPAKVNTENFVTKFQPMVHVNADLVFVHVEAFLSGGTSRRNRWYANGMVNEAEESKLMSLCVDVKHWESDGEVVVMNMPSHQQADFACIFELIEEMEKCAQILNDDKLSNDIGRLAFGFVTFQRASIKHELREVGLIVVETNRFIDDDDEKMLGKLDGFGFIGTKKVNRDMQHADSLTDVNGRKVPHRVLLISAPDHVLQLHAVNHNWRCFVAADRETGVIEGGFRHEQFIRDGPLQHLWIASKSNPYPYQPYFLSRDFFADPTSIFNAAERKHLVRLFITDPISELRMPDGSDDRSEGGANMDPKALIAQETIEDFIVLHELHATEAILNSALETNLRPPMSLFAPEAKCVLDLVSRPVASICFCFGPQIASYFVFMNHYKTLLMILSPFGFVGYYAGQPANEESTEFWRFVQPSLGMLAGLFGACFCATWRRCVSKLAFGFENGVLEFGYELRSATLCNASEKVRADFAFSYRKHFEHATVCEQEKQIESIRKYLRLDRISKQLKPEAMKELESSNSDRMFRRDIEMYNGVGYVPQYHVILKQLAVSLISIVLIGISLFSTFACFYISDFITNSEVLTSVYAANIIVYGQRVSAARIMAALISGASTGAIVPALNAVNLIAATYTTNLQNFRNDADHRESLFMKNFAFQFFNRFNSLLWIAFWHQDLNRLQIQIIFMIVMPTFTMFMLEIVLPYVKKKRVAERLLARGKLIKVGGTYIPTAASKGGDLGRSLSQMSHQALASINGTFDIDNQLIEMLVQFGLVSMFIMACPIAPFVAWLNIIFMQKTSMYKLCRLQRMPEPQQILGIGVSYRGLQATCYFALVCNCAMIIFSKVDNPLLPPPDNYDVSQMRSIEGLAILDIVFPRYAGVTKLVLLFIGQNLVLLLMTIIFSVKPLPAYQLDELYRQAYFQYRQSAP